MKKAILMFVVVLATAAVLGGLAAIPSTVQNAHANPCSDIEVGGVGGGESNNNDEDTGDVDLKCDLEHVDVEEEPPV